MDEPDGGRPGLLAAAERLVAAWERRFGSSEPHPATVPDPARLAHAWEDFGRRMEDHYPFFHPRYAGQMLKPPNPVAAAGYLAAMLINPNNHALDGGPGTSALELEVLAALVGMFGLPERTLGHLTSSGTIANLEALWVARELHPNKRIVHSQAAHYTHARMCKLLGVQASAVPSTPDGRIDLDAVSDECRRGDVGTVVLTLGSTGLGAIDRIDQALALRERYDVRLHVDAAYGGFFTLLADGSEPLVDPAPFAAVRACDSVVVDPHKHGLQPYGCGAVLFADPTVARLYRHDSPYTYFTSEERHLGEISLECSRAGAAAAALWLTLQVFPLERDDGLGAILAACRRGAQRLGAVLAGSERLTPHVAPELDIVTCFARERSLTRIDSVSARMLADGMADRTDPLFLSLLTVDAPAFRTLHPGVQTDAPAARIVRSVLMKPEHEHATDWLAARLEALAAG
ncbi:aminotransferase class V-fold PLP-dependent enzyme [Conexibacter sp. S30A1]|uniref:pyridoxal phosphate-dependent decarboxylase family protein n=1 Tax=Conexibacter sp. S30A1 TaxID=2937800 RepID=UPI00200BC52B|nr:aminotransferase class V-fold PLP-dependent enzyme [Conexibacter sp. S30A1]